MKHKMQKREYCEQFGLNYSNGLCSDSYSYNSENSLRIRMTDPKQREANAERLRKMSKSALEKARASNGFNKKSVEMENEWGTCELQIKYRLVEYIKHYKDLPSRSTKGEGGRICKVLRTRHGSLNNGFKAVGLPVRYRTGTSVELVSPDGKQYFFNYNKDYNKQNVFNWMMAHCPILREVNLLPIKEQ